MIRSRYKTRYKIRGEASASKKENLFVVAVIILCFVTTLGLSFLFSGKGILGIAEVLGKENERTFFAVAIGGYSDITLARNTADLIKQRGGAGYCIVTNGENGQEIEIVFSIYKDMASAESVLSSIEDRSAYVKEITAKESKYSWCEGDLKSAVKDAMTYFDTAFDEVYNTSSSLNDNTLNVYDAKTKIKVLITHIDDIKSVFYQKTQNQDKQQITEIKLALITTLALLDNIDFESQAKCCSSLRYQLVQLVLCYKVLCASI